MEREEQDALRQEELTQRYLAAVNSFVDKLKTDPNIIAVYLCGSLSHAKVWEKSNVDMVVIVRDQELTTRSYSIDEDDIILNVDLTTRSAFKRDMGKQKGGSVGHSVLALGRFLYTTDDSLEQMAADFREMGDDDIELSFFHRAAGLVWAMEKIEKWLRVRKDPTYAQYYILTAADILAGMEMLVHRAIPTREAVLDVEALCPGFIRPFYQDPLSRPYGLEDCWATLDLMKKYLADHTGLVAAPVLECMGDGEIKTVTELVKHLEMDSHSITHVFEFLEEQGIVAKVTQTIRITPKGKKAVEEVAYMLIAE